MTVAEVWGRIQNYDALLTSQDGDLWNFKVPSWVTSPIIVEFWARDDVGNTSYRAGVFTLEAGTVKCVRWLKTDGICIKLPTPRSTIDMVDVRSKITMVKHVCPMIEG